MSDTGENRIHEFVTKLVRVHSDITSMCVCVYTVVILVRVHTVVILVRVHSGITSMCVYTVVILVRVHSDIISACTQ